MNISERVNKHPLFFGEGAVTATLKTLQTALRISYQMTEQISDGEYRSEVQNFLLQTQDRFDSFLLRLDGLEANTDRDSTNQMATVARSPI